VLLLQLFLFISSKYALVNFDHVTDLLLLHAAYEKAPKEYILLRAKENARVLSQYTSLFLRFPTNKPRTATGTIPVLFYRRTLRAENIGYVQCICVELSDDQC